jgi:hypothetical protein
MVHAKAKKLHCGLAQKALKRVKETVFFIAGRRE